MVLRERRAVLRALAMCVMSVGVVLGALVAPAPAGACSMLAMSADFEGTIVAIDDTTATYRVDRVRQDDDDRLPAPREVVAVRYDESVDVLALGASYRVKGWGDRVDGVSSQIAYDFDGDCGTGEGTTALDGSYLGSSSGGLARLWPYAAVGLVATGALVAGRAVVARRGDRAPR